MCALDGSPRKASKTIRLRQGETSARQDARSRAGDRSRMCRSRTGQRSCRGREYRVASTVPRACGLAGDAVRCGVFRSTITSAPPSPSQRSHVPNCAASLVSLEVSGGVVVVVALLSSGDAIHAVSAWVIPIISRSSHQSFLFPLTSASAPASRPLRTAWESSRSRTAAHDNHHAARAPWPSRSGKPEHRRRGKCSP